VVRWRASKGRSEPPSAYRPSGFTIVTVTPDNLQWAEDVGSSLCDALRPAEPAPLPPSLGWRGPPLRGPARSSWPRTSLSRSRPAKCPGMVVNQTAAIEGLVRRETESETVQISSCRHAHGPRRSSMGCGGSARAVRARLHVLRGVVVRGLLCWSRPRAEIFRCEHSDRRSSAPMFLARASLMFPVYESARVCWWVRRKDGPASKAARASPRSAVQRPVSLSFIFLFLLLTLRS
jgi:hypothetical protein